MPHSPGRRRAYVVAAIVLMLGLGYVAFLPGEVGGSAEQNFGSPATEGGPPQLGVYAVLSVDAINQALQLRLHFTPRNGLRGERPNTPGRDLALRIDDGFDVQEMVLRANEPIAPATLDTSLDGSTIADYPFERFHGELRIAAQDGLVPVRLTLWKGISGWVVRANEEPGDGGQIRLHLIIRRTRALTFLAIALYAVMIVIAGAALTFGGLIFLRIRKLEATLASFLSGMLFALPAMRFALPGSPPLGVIADQLIFLWAELAVALGLLLFVLSWALHGPRQ